MLLTLIKNISPTRFPVHYKFNFQTRHSDVVDADKQFYTQPIHSAETLSICSLRY